MPEDEDDHPVDDDIGLDDHEDHFNEPTPAASPSPESQPSSHEDSRADQRKRKHQDLETSSSSDCEANNGHKKAQKINNKAGRPQAGDYEDLAKELILQAATVYHCLLSTEDAFPDLATEAEMVKTAWGWVNRETGLTFLRLTPDIAKI